MNKNTLKIVGSTLSAVALVSGGAAIAAAPGEAIASSAPDMAAEASESAVDLGSTVKAPVVEGSFSFDQAAVSDNADISNIFAKAAATLCNAMPVYQAQAASAAIEVSAEDGSSFTATVDDMANSEGAESYTMACACSTNAPGGGAIANAEVEGVSLASIMEMAAA